MVIQTVKHILLRLMRQNCYNHDSDDDVKKDVQIRYFNDIIAADSLHTILHCDSNFQDC